MTKFLKGMKVQVVANAGTSFDGLIGEVVQTQTNAADPVWVEFEGGLRTQMSTNRLFVPAKVAALDHVKALAFALIEEQKDWCDLPEGLNLPDSWILVNENDREVWIVDSPDCNLNNAVRLAQVDYSIPGDYYDENLCN